MIPNGDCSSMILKFVFFATFKFLICNNFFDSKIN